MEKSKIFHKLIVFVVIGFIAFSSYSLGRQGYVFEFRNKTPQVFVQNRIPQDQTVDFNLFWRAFDLLNQKYLEGIKDAKKALYGAAVGLYNSVGDPYTAFLPPPENKQVNDSLAGRYEGIGAELSIKDSQLTVVTPLEGSPAEEAGLKAGDQILKIDGKETRSITLSEAVTKIRGDQGTKVTLNVRHENSMSKAEASPSAVSGQDSSAQKYSDPLDVQIIRGPIKTVSLKWEEKAPGIVYVRLSRFGDSTNTEWDKAVSEIFQKIKRPSGPAAVILDFRGNPGGYFQAAVHIGSEFIEGGVISYQEYRHGLRQEFKVDHLGRFLKIPGVVLVDKGSASASEIVAGALRDRRGFRVVGEKSFGKGTVQDTESFPDGSGVHITIARWLTPSGYSINGAGIDPDFKVEFSDRDANNNKDPQLDKALEVAKNLK